MAKISKLAYNLWFQAQLGAPPFIQNLIISPLVELKEIFRIIKHPFFDIYRIQDQNQAGSLTATYFTTKEIRASRQFRGIFFTENLSITPLGRVPIWNIHKEITSVDSDIIMVETDKRLVNRLPYQKAIVIPLQVLLQIDVRGSWDDVKNRFHKTVSHTELRLTQKHGYTYHLSYDPQEFEYFYHQMYLPTMEDRHGDLNLPLAKEDLIVYLKHGFLFLIKKAEQVVAGGLCYPQQKTLTLLVGGLLNADEELRRQGAMGAMRTLLIQWANQAGFETFNFGDSGPFLAGGIFQYKRKWGAKVVARNRRIWLKVQRNNPAVCQLLKDHPIITVDKKGDLHGLIIVNNSREIDTSDEVELQKKYATPGLNSLLIRSMADLVVEPIRAA